MTDEEARISTLKQIIAEQNPDAILWEDCDAAIVGMVSRCGSDPVVCYDYDKLIECMIDPKSAHEDWNAAYEEALAAVDANIANSSYIGEYTPFILHAYCPPPGYKVQDDD